MSDRFDTAIKNVSKRLRESLQKIPDVKKSDIFEIRLREDAPLMLISASGTEFMNVYGRASSFYSDTVLTVSKADIEETFLRLCDYSVHSFEKEIREGFVTSKEGHRAGICGKVTCSADGFVKGYSEITSINLRIARDFHGVSSKLCRTVFANGLCSIIVAGSPVSGKTTLLRDIGKQLSEGNLGEYYKVSVIDSRREFVTDKSSLRYCDVFSGCEKSYGIINAIRNMSPQMVICDELSTAEEAVAVSKGFASGVEFAVSIHAKGVEDLRKRAVFCEAARLGQFRYTVLLDGESPCHIKKIYETEELI